MLGGVLAPSRHVSSIISRRFEFASDLSLGTPSNRVSRLCRSNGSKGCRLALFSGKLAKTTKILPITCAR